MCNALWILAQETPPAAPWWQVLMDNALGLTILFIFLAAIIGAVVRMRKRDKCLKLLHDDHVSYITADGKVIWGDMLTFSQGIELRFDAPYLTPRGMVKNSALIYPNELETCLAICRTAAGLTEKEQKRRAKQIRRSFNPGPIRRGWRSVRNLFNTMRDAVSKAFGAALGQVAKAKPGSVMGTQKGQVEQIGQTLIGAANAYEPILERHIGKPVVLRLQSPASEHKRPIEIPGYLVDYSKKYVAIFNVEHSEIESLELVVMESTTQSGMAITLDDKSMAVTCTGEDLLIIKSLEVGDKHYDLDAVLTCGTTLKLPRAAGQPVKLAIDRTRQIDLVCPRAQATIRFGSERDMKDPDRSKIKAGIAPESDLEDAS